MAVLFAFGLKTHTIDNDKDANTGISVEVHDINGSTIARIDGAESGTHYDNGSIHTFRIMPLVPNIPKEQCLPCSWSMGIQANGSDEWAFDAWLFVVFSDNTSTFGDKLGQDINSMNSQLIMDNFSYTHNTAGSESETAKEVEERLNEAVKKSLAKPNDRTLPKKTPNRSTK